MIKHFSSAVTYDERREFQNESIFQTWVNSTTDRKS